jgi:crossover junction endodeoxyribonuclease RuvC
MILLGVDPGLLRMGYGVIENQGSDVRLKEGGIIQGGPSSTPLEERLITLYNGINEVIAEYAPEVMALEEIYSHYAYPNTAILMGHARGVVCLAAAQNGMPVFNYAATMVKNSLTGSGRASKMQVQKAVTARLNLSQIPEPNDVADALALAICHWQIAATESKILQGLKVR